MAKQCPKCKSSNIDFRREFTGSKLKSNYYKYHNDTGVFIPKWNKSSSRKREHITIGLCKDCGYTWEVNNPTGIKVTFGGIIAIFALVVIFASVIVGGNANMHREKESLKVGSSSTSDSGIWAVHNTPIEDFEYEIHYGDELHLIKYTGSADTIWLADRFELDGEDKYHITYLSGTFKDTKIKSVIVPYGTLKILNGAFSGSEVEYLYLPSTLETFDGWSELTNIKKIYYAGSERQFKKLFAGSSPDDFFVEGTVVYNASLDDVE